MEQLKDPLDLFAESACQITIRDLSVRPGRSVGIPFVVVNCVFKCEDGYFQSKSMGYTTDYHQVVVTGTPEEEFKEFEKLFEEEGDFISHINSLPFKSKVWTYNDPFLTYIPKFDVFWLREWVADCPVTKAVLEDLFEYQTTGKFSVPYRSADEEIVLKHLRTLNEYWD